MSKEPTDVMIGADLTTDTAKADHEAVTHAGVKLEGVILVSRDQVGKLHIEEEDHLARKGAEILGGAGVIVGLFAPPKLAGSAIGAVSGGVLGDLAHHEVKKKIELQVFDTIPFGGAGLVVAYPRSPVRRLATADTKAMTAGDRTVQAARADSADAQAHHGQLKGQDSQSDPAARAGPARGPVGHRARRTACPCVDRGAGGPQGVTGAVVTRASQSAPNRAARELSRHAEVMAENTAPCDAVAPFPARLRRPLG
jgi:uncharacterized membrane protein